MTKAERVGLGGVLFVGLAACSGAGPVPEPGGNSGTAASAAPHTTALLYFDGEVDVTAATMKLSVHSPSGQLKEQAILPYGTGGGDVYFHTCASPAVSYTPVGAGGHLDGLVQAVNNMAGAIPDLSVKMNLISDPGTTFSTTLGGGNLYGSVPSTGATSCAANTATWTFTQTSATNFFFRGEADGTVPVGHVIHLGGGIVTIPGSSTLNDENLYTLEGWISEDSPGGGSYQGFLSQDPGGCCTIRMLISPSLNPFVNAGHHTDVTFGGFAFTVPAWHHWAMTCGAGTATSWVDGANVGTTVCADPGNISTSSIYLGAGEGGGPYRLTGRLAEIRVSNIVRYASAFTPQKRFVSDANTMMLQHFDTGSGTTTLDSSGHGNNGTFSGVVTWVTDDRP